MIFKKLEQFLANRFFNYKNKKIKKIFLKILVRTFKNFIILKLFGISKILFLEEFEVKRFKS